MEGKAKRIKKWRRKPPEGKRLARTNSSQRDELAIGSEPTSIDRYALSLIEYSFDLILLLDRRGIIIYISPSVERLLGYCAEDALGTRVFAYIHPDDLQRATDFYFDRYDPTDTPRLITLRVRHWDGSWRYMEAVGNNLLDDPLVQGIVINARDITERKRLEAGLRRSEEYYRHLIETATDIIAVLDQNGIIRYITPSVERMAGYRPEDITGKYIFDFAHPDDIKNGADALSFALGRSGVTQYLELRIKHTDGTWHYYEVSANNLLHNRAVKGLVINARDVTDRKRWEEALRESEERYRLIYDFSGEAIYTCDTSLTLIGLNKIACELIGYEEQEIMGKNILELNIIHPDDFESMANDIQRLSMGEVVNDELRFVRKNGSVVIGEVTGAPLYNQEGEIMAFTNVARDITERKLAEEALRESEERYRLIFDCSGEAIFTYDRDFKVTEVNRRGCELIGYTEEELIGHDMLKLGILHPDDVEEVLANDLKMMAGEVITTELRFITKSGEVLLGEVTGTALLNQEGKGMAVTNIAHDITARKRAQERLARINQCFLALGPDPLENIKSIVMAGGDILKEYDLHYTRMDEGRLTIFSPSREHEGFVATDSSDRFLCYNILRSGDKAPMIIEDLRGTGYEIPLSGANKDFRSALGFPVRLRGKEVGALCLLAVEEGSFEQEDVNFLSMLARALTIEEERLAHEQSIRHFVDIASHELRTPLSIIKGYADAFQCGDLQDLDEMQLDKIRIINAKADKMAKTINELLDLSRIERGHFIIEKKEVELAPLVESAARQMQEKGASNDFHVCIADAIGTHAVDPENLVDALLILLDNAVNYSAPDSTIRVEARPQDGGVVFSVMDRGAGIPEKDRNTIFERFYQVEDSEHHSISGMGLGLYIAREIIQGHDGRIWCEPREGGGTVFSFFVP